MTLTKEDAKKATWVLGSKFVNLKLNRIDQINREHLPVIDVRDVAFMLTNDEWNTLMDRLADAAASQPFSDAYLWPRHEKNEFARWLRSWKI